MAEDMIERAARAAQHAKAHDEMDGELPSLDEFLVEQYAGENKIVLTMRAAARAALLAAFDSSDIDLVATWADIMRRADEINQMHGGPVPCPASTYERHARAVLTSARNFAPFTQGER